MAPSPPSLVKVRITIDPDSPLHVGTAHTALFAYFFAHKYSGELLVHVADHKGTNVERSLNVLDDLAWLDIRLQPKFQSTRWKRYYTAAVKLVERDHAYPSLPGSNTSLRGNLRNQAPVVAVTMLAEEAFDIRFKIPEAEVTSLHDAIRGKMRWVNAQLSDPIIWHAEGGPSAWFADLIDDIDESVTTVVVGDDEDRITPFYILAARAIGEKATPGFAHVPHLGCPLEKHKKFSKQRALSLTSYKDIENLRRMGLEVSINFGPAQVNYYRTLGVPADAVRNYVGKLGWKKEDELLNMNTMCSEFAFDKVLSIMPTFEPNEVFNYSDKFMKIVPFEQTIRRNLDMLKRASIIPDELSLEELCVAIDSVWVCRERIGCYADVISATSFMFSRPRLDFEDIDEHVTPVIAQLRELFTWLHRAEWKADVLQKGYQTYCTQNHWSMNKLILALRFIILGQQSGPALFPVMQALGRDECLNRFADTLKRAEPEMLEI